MLSNLVGLCELARATGDASLLEPVTQRLEGHRRRTGSTSPGSASAGEHFQDDHVLPNQVGANICETCVTTTWIQLNLQLLRLTGEIEYGDELERSFYNHLAAAQHPRGDDWCYYTALEGKKPYDPGINCCHSSGPRGMALAVQAAYLENHARRSTSSGRQYLREFPRRDGVGRSEGFAHPEQSSSPRGGGNPDLSHGQASNLWAARQGAEMGPGAALGAAISSSRWTASQRARPASRRYAEVRPGSGRTATESSFPTSSAPGSSPGISATRIAPRWRGAHSCWPTIRSRNPGLPTPVPRPA